MKDMLPLLTFVTALRMFATRGLALYGLNYYIIAGS
jgi:hypothetical protein